MNPTSRSCSIVSPHSLVDSVSNDLRGLAVVFGQSQGMV